MSMRWRAPGRLGACGLAAVTIAVPGGVNFAAQPGPMEIAGDAWIHRLGVAR